LTGHYSTAKKTKMLSISPTYLLYYVPLIISIALVFAATRHEDTSLIIQHCWHTARWITVFMGVIFVVLYGLGLMV
jgi:hypothetical protein